MNERSSETETNADLEHFSDTKAKKSKMFRLLWSLSYGKKHIHKSERPFFFSYSVATNSAKAYSLFSFSENYKRNDQMEKKWILKNTNCVGPSKFEIEPRQRERMIKNDVNFLWNILNISKIFRTNLWNKICSGHWPLKLNCVQNSRELQKQTKKTNERRNETLFPKAQQIVSTHSR